MRRIGVDAAWCVTCGLALVAAPLRAQTIDTGTPPADVGGVFLGYTSPSLAHSVAQTFVVPPGATVLDDFAFWLRDAALFDATRFRAYVYAWSDAGLHVTGSALWTSDVAAGTSVQTPVRYAFGTGGLALAPGQRYAAVLSPLQSAPGAAGTSGGTAVMALFGAPAYADGQGFAVATDPGLGLGGLASTAWTGYADGADHAFTASFTASVVPEPRPAWLVAGGVLAVVAAARRRSARG